MTGVKGREQNGLETLKNPSRSLTRLVAREPGPARENMVTARLGGGGAGVYAAPP